MPQTRTIVNKPTQEIWIVICGVVKVDYYDEDGIWLDHVILERGGLTITYRGAHKYTAIDDDTLVYEIKNGPYNGKELDKKIIEDKENFLE